MTQACIIQDDLWPERAFVIYCAGPAEAEDEDEDEEMQDGQDRAMEGGQPWACVWVGGECEYLDFDLDNSGASQGDGHGLTRLLQAFCAATNLHVDRARVSEAEGVSERGVSGRRSQSDRARPRKHIHVRLWSDKRCHLRLDQL